MAHRGALCGIFIACFYFSPALNNAQKPQSDKFPKIKVSNTVLLADWKSSLKQ